MYHNNLLPEMSCIANLEPNRIIRTEQMKLSVVNNHCNWQGRGEGSGSCEA